MHDFSFGTIGNFHLDFPINLIVYQPPGLLKKANEEREKANEEKKKANQERKKANQERKKALSPIRDE